MSDDEDFNRLKNYFLKDPALRFFYTRCKKGGMDDPSDYCNNINMYYRRNKNYTLLYSAVKLQDTELVKKILRIPTLNVNKGCREETPLMLACRLPRTNEIVSLLLSHPKIDVNRSSRTVHPAEVSSGSTGATALFYATNWHLPEHVKLLLTRSDIDVDKGTRDGDSPLLEVAKNYLNSLSEEKDISSAFQFELGADMGCKEETCDPTSHTRHESAREKFRQRYLEKKRATYECLTLLAADPRVKDIDRVYTICRDFKLAIQLTLERPSSRRDLTFHILSRESVLNCLNDVIELLESRNPTYSSVYSFATEASTQYSPTFHGEIESVLESFDDNRCFVNYWPSYIFERIKEAYIVKNGDINTGKIQSHQHYFSERWVTLYECGTVLADACKQKNLEEVKRCLAEPTILVNKPDRFQWCPLHEACTQGDIAIVKCLLAFPGMNPNVLSGKGHSPLYIACESGNLEIVKELLKHPLTKTHTYKKAIQYAIETKNTEVLEMFLSEFQKTARQKHPNNRVIRRILQDCLLTACKDGNLEIIQRMIQAGARINQRGKNETKPLEAAIRGGEMKIVKYLRYHPQLRLRKEGSMCYRELKVAATGLNTEIFIFLFDSWKGDLTEDELYAINKELRSLYSSKVEYGNPAECSGLLFLGKHVLKCLHLRSLARINTFGRLKDGRPLPYLPPELYKNIASFLSECRIGRRIVENSSPEDEVEIEEMELEEVYHQGLLYYRDTLTDTLYEENAEGYLVRATVASIPRRR